MRRFPDTFRQLATAVACCAPWIAGAQAPTLRDVEPGTLRSVPAETTAAAYVDKRWRAPRTSWGHPSFEGVWSTDDLRGVPMSRPAKIGTRLRLSTSSECSVRTSRRSDSSRPSRAGYWPKLVIARQMP